MLLRERDRHVASLLAMTNWLYMSNRHRSQITGKPVREVVFLYLQPKSEVALPDLGGAMADAQAAAQLLLQSS